MRSLRSRLAVLWTLSLVASAALALLLLHLYRQSTDAQVGRAQAVIARACDLIGERFSFYAAGWSDPVPLLTDPALRADLTAVVTLALARQNGVEGGIWQGDAGSLAYAYPTYEGSGPKTDLPAAERDQIAAVNQQALRDEQSVERRSATRSQTLLIAACPLSGPIGGLTAWTMVRVQSPPGLDALQLGLGSLLALMVLMSAWLGRTLHVWGGHVERIEAALGAAGGGAMPMVARTGERELDRIIDALNEAAQRLEEARRETDEMAARAARAERLAGLGRVAAGVAHEIRNPLAAARLQGENALAGNDARRRQAIGAMLGQIGRLDTLVAELLAMTQRAEPHPEPVALAPLLAEAIGRHEPVAAVRHVTLQGTGKGVFTLDPAMTGRILDNLLANAVRHATAGGTVRLSAAMEGDGLAITVADDGPGVPATMAERLFEPFVTGRADGTGIGLAIARELADAQGGRLTLRSAGGDEAGTVFALELPVRAGSESCPAS